MTQPVAESMPIEQSTNERPLLVAGWSTRAAVQSARRAGIAVAAFDVFADADLAAAAATCRRLRSLGELASAAAELPSSAWLYTGGLENHPAIVAAVARRHRLLGIDVDALRQVRDPRRLQRAFRAGSAPLPEVRSTAPPGDGRTWLVKQRRSGGGVRIEWYDAARPLPRGAYLQEFVAGVPCGASYLAAGGSAQLLGVCRQTLAAVDRRRPFLYGGSQGPLPLDPATAAALQQLGDALAAEFGLVGLFGVDVVLAADGSLRTLEVNPRYTASMELLERALGASLIERHVAACRHGRLSALPEPRSQHAKRILYVDAAAPTVVTATLAAALIAEAGIGPLPTIADLPQAGTRLRPGEPLCTLLADSPTGDGLQDRLDECERRVRALLAASHQAGGSSAATGSSPRRRRPANAGS